MNLQCVVLILVIILTATKSKPTTETTTTARSTTRPHIDETIKQLTNQLMENNTTITKQEEIITLDTRTPPKVKQQTKNKTIQKIENFKLENSHAGIAIPIDDDIVNLDETTKKLNFYKIEQRPTTNSGLSTWILLSGQQTGSTTKSPHKNQGMVVKIPNNQHKNVTIHPQLSVPLKNKPMFKKRLTSTTIKPTTTKQTNTTKLTKIKASILNNAKKGQNNTVVTTTTPSNPTTLLKKNQITSTTTTEKTVTTTTQENDLLKNITTIDSNKLLPIEAKDDEIDLTTTTSEDKKSRRPTTNKRKKNKNKRRRPSVADKSNNSTKLEKHNNKTKEKPISTQLYNYLSREVMPTVGVGLVGLMVTAGLASYFLYPFGVARRSYDVIDRKDKDSSNYYYYNDDYSGGIAEEEAIGKVIAGMPANTFAFNTVSKQSSTNRNSYGNNNNNNNNNKYNNRNRQVDHRTSATSFNYPFNNLNSASNSNDFLLDRINDNSNNNNKEFDYTTTIDDDNKKFVVGNVPKEVINDDDIITPAAVPEHGPRKFRKKRQLTSTISTINENENELNSDFDTSTFIPPSSFEEVSNVTFSNNITSPATTTTTNDKLSNIFSLMRDLFRLKVNLGLQLIQNATQSISRYVSKVQKRLDEHYRNNPTS